MVKRIYLDIETLPPDESARADITVRTVRKLDRRFVASERRDDEPCNDAEFRRLALFAEYGRVLCIGVCIEEEGKPERGGVLGQDKQTKLLHADEQTTLRGFWKLLADFRPQRDLLIGHNILDFDLPFIYQRSWVNGIEPSIGLCFARYRSRPIYDTMREWAKWNQKRCVSLGDLATVLRLDAAKPDGMSGERVYEAFHAGEHEQIAAYCLQDVAIVRAIYRRMSGG